MDSWHQLHGPQHPDLEKMTFTHLSQNEFIRYR